MSSSRIWVNLCPTFTKTGMWWQILVKVKNIYFYKMKPFTNSRILTLQMTRQNYLRTFPQVIVPKDVSLMKLTEEWWRILWLRCLMYMELRHNFTRQEMCEKVCGVSNRPIIFTLYNFPSFDGWLYSWDNTPFIIPYSITVWQKKKYLLRLPQSLALSILLPSQQQLMLTETLVR